LFHNGTKVGPEMRLDLDVNKATGRQVTLSEPPAQKYSAGGAFTLVDGVAPDDASSGEGWLGFNGSDMDAKIDLGSEVEVSRVRVDYGNAAGRWIYPPRSVEVLFSADGVHYQPAGALQPVASDSVHTATLELGKVKTRYLRVKALNHGVIPAGNPGAGSKSWLFVGEISVE
jgi:hexosaminidase